MIDVKGAVRRLGARLASSVVRGVVSLINDDGDMQLIQVRQRFEDVTGNVEHFQPFGLSFHPNRGSECIVLAVGASQDNLVAILANDRAIRPTAGEEGEGGLYSSDGWRVYLANDGTTNLGAQDATQSVLRGEDLRSALSSYADAVSNAVGSIAVSGTPATDNGTILLAKQALAQASLQLISDVNSALSPKVKTE